MMNAPADFDSIPLIDYAAIASRDPAERSRAAQDLRRACEQVGFFYVRNHGVPQPVIDACFEQAQRFFAQPLAVKMQSHADRASQHRGYSAMGDEQVDEAGQKDRNEAFDLSHDVPRDDPEVLRGCWLSGPNLWPEPEPPGFRAALEAYYAAVLSLGRRLFGAFALALGMPEDSFDAMLHRPGSFMRLLHYPPQPPQEEALGIGEHSDYECFTILAQDEVGGLEVCNAAGRWIPAPPIAGTFVINIGDMMARWTNDRFASTRHRVINRSGRERYSIPFFYGVDYDVTIATLPACLAPGELARYAPVNAHDYVAGRINATYGGA